MAAVVFAAFFIFHFTFYISKPAFAQNIPLFPLQEDLRDEIFGTGRQSAQIGLGEEAIGELDARIFALRFARGALAFVGLVFLVVILYGGFTYMTSGGSEEKMEKAKTMIGRASIGMALVLSSYAIALFVSRQIVRVTFEQTLTQIQNCNTSSGVSACCREWSAYQGRITARPIWERGDDPEARRLYEEWRQGFSRGHDPTSGNPRRWVGGR